jgi:hypothetical protein
VFRRFIVAAFLSVPILALPAQAATSASIVTFPPGRVDPCKDMRIWQMELASSPDDPTILDLVGEKASACAQTYEVTDHLRLCDLYRLAASAYNAEYKMETEIVSKRIDLAHLFDSYISADSYCSSEVQAQLKPQIDELRSLLKQ